MENREVSLTTLKGGGAIEVFDHELARVLANIMDPNTKLDVREIVLRVKIKPDENRSAAAVAISCSSKLAPAGGFSTSFFIGKQAGRVVAIENDPKQMNLFNEQTPALAVVKEAQR